MTEEDIQKIINSPEKENITIELKSFRKLFNADGDNRKEIAAEISALSNRHGGTLIFGLNNDGTFDPKNDYNIDKAKEIINQVCHDNISPVIDCSTQFLQCKDGDLLIVFIPKRKEIPHAVIAKREGGEIKSRIYYIRTSHGKSLVSDNQLEWLFKQNKDPGFSHSFRISVEFDKDLNVLGGNITQGVYYISELLGYLENEELKALQSDTRRFFKLIIELFPYFILKSISDYFSQTWYIGIDQKFNRTSSGPMITNTPCKSLPIEMKEIKAPNYSIISSLRWDFNKVLQEVFPNKFHIPPKTEIQIAYEKNGKFAKIIMKNPDFSFEIKVGMLASGAGLHQMSPRAEVLWERFPFKAQEYLMSNFRHFDGAGYFDASFDFPEKNIDEFKKFHHYSEILKQLIDDNWNFNVIRAKLPSKEILVIDHKLNEIIKTLRREKIKKK